MNDYYDAKWKRIPIKWIDVGLVIAFVIVTSALLIDYPRMWKVEALTTLMDASIVLIARARIALLVVATIVLTAGAVVALLVYHARVRKQLRKP